MAYEYRLRLKAPSTLTFVQALVFKHQKEVGVVSQMIQNRMHTDIFHESTCKVLVR